MTLPAYSPPTGLVSIPSGVELAYHPVDVTDPTDRAYLQATSSMTAFSSAEAWLNYHRIGEVRYAIARSARLAGYATLKGVKVDASGSVIQEAERGVVAEIINGIYSPFGGLRGLIERFYTLRQVPGEAWLAAIRRDANEMDGYWFLSPSEIKQESAASDSATTKPVMWQTARRLSENGSKSVFQREIMAKDFYGRVWSPSHQHVDEVDSPMDALNPMCDMLHKLTLSIKGRLEQRFAIAGILLIPNEISDAAITGAQPSANRYSNDKVLNYLIHVMTTNIVSHSDALAKIPILLKGPADVLDKMRHVILEATVAETDLKLRAELIGRILDGLNQNKSAATGMSDQNHFGAWMQGDDERRVAVQPDIESMCHALTRMVLWRELKARGWDPARIRPWRVWFDLSAASVKSNQSEDARQAFDRGLVGADYTRSVIGAKETDKMTDAEYVRWVGNQMKNPVLALYGLESVDVDWDRAEAWGKKSGPTPDTPADDSQAGPGGGGSDGSPDTRDTDTPKSEEPVS